MCSDAVWDYAMKRFKPYPAYKDSGVAWLGRIPAHWELKRLKRLAAMQAGSAITSESIEPTGDYPVFGGNGIRGFTDSFTHEGDLPLIGRQGALCGCVNLASGKFWASEHAVVARPAQDVDAFWLTALLESMSLNTYSQSAAQPGIAVETMGAISAPAPPLPEQRAIAAFLDRETAKIDALVAKKERLIALLQEKRSALISHAVTKGLDPTVPMKDSGVEWLGAIPAHWEVKRLKRLFRVINGSTPASGDPAFWAGEIPWVTPEDLGDLKDRTITSTRRNITEAGYRSCGTTLVPAGSLVLSTRAPIGHLAIAGVNLCTNQGCRSLVFRDPASRAFWYYELLAARPELESLGQGSTFRELAKGMLEDVTLAVPPLPEQRAIAAFLDRETAKIDALIAKVREAIERLKEYRSALISAAVTGKIDVREAVAA